VDLSALKSDIQSALPALDLRKGELLSRHCSFRIGGPAALMALPASTDELMALCALLRSKGHAPFIMGNGTNLLFPDEGLDRMVIKLCPNLSDVTVSGNIITAGAGATLAKTASAALNAGLTGLEFAHGIPGSVGGGVVMNAGAYGGELKDCVTATDCLDENLKLRTLRGEEHQFSYRHSILSEKDWIVLRSQFTLTRGDRDAISDRMQELAAKRRASQPLDMPSAGSTFKRPAGGFAAALIDEAGLKGFSIGGAQVSPKHAGFVVNTGDASCEDVLRLMDHIRNTVRARSGIELEPEVRIIGR